MAKLHFIAAFVLFALLQQTEAQQRGTVRGVARKGVIRQRFAPTASSSAIHSNGSTVFSTSGSPTFPSGEVISMYIYNYA